MIYLSHPSSVLKGDRLPTYMGNRDTTNSELSHLHSRMRAFLRAWLLRWFDLLTGVFHNSIRWLSLNLVRLQPN